MLTQVEGRAVQSCCRPAKIPWGRQHADGLGVADGYPRDWVVTVVAALQLSRGPWLPSARCIMLHGWLNYRRGNMATAPPKKDHHNLIVGFAALPTYFL